MDAGYGMKRFIAIGGMSVMRVDARRENKDIFLGSTHRKNDWRFAPEFFRH